MKSALFSSLQGEFSGELRDDSLSRSLYANDASVYQRVPKGVAIPKGEKDLRLLLNWSKRENCALIPRAAGTSLAGQCVGEGLIVDVSKYMNQILHFDPIKKQVTVEPGVIRDELNQFLAPHGLFFGPNTSTANRCTIGGMVGNNSSGTTSIRYGVTRDKVIGLRTVLSDGSVHEFGSVLKSANEAPQVSDFGKQIEQEIISLLQPKSVQEEIVSAFPKAEIHRRNTGYALDAMLSASVFGGNQPFNLSKLLCGSEGTLAFSSQITLALDDLMPTESAMVVTHYKTLESALSDVAVVMEQELYTCEMMDKVILDCTKGNHLYSQMRSFIEGDPHAVLMLEVRAETNDLLEQKLDQLLCLLAEKSESYAHPVLREAQIGHANELRKAGLGLLGNMVGDQKAVACIEDTAVALADLKPFILEFSEIMNQYQQKAVYYAHAGAGELHLRPILDLKKGSDVKLFRAITTDVALLTKKYRGSFSGEHGDGIVRAEFIPMLIGEKNYELLKKVKTIFDPFNLLNPHKIVDPYPMDKGLRYEVDRREPAIETFLNFDDSRGYLRAIEKCNGSGDCRKTENASGGMCPSFHATRDEKDTTRGRANALRVALSSDDQSALFRSTEALEVLDLCISCKACASECPSNVDMATLKTEYLYQYQERNGYSFRSKLFAYSTHANRLASYAAPLVNIIYKSAIGNLIKKASGIAGKRSIRSVYRVNFKAFLKQLQQTKPVSNSAREVVLYIDEFSQFLDVEVTKSAIRLLHNLGFSVQLIYGESGRTFISKGFLKQARSCAAELLPKLETSLKNGLPILGIEPSAILSFRDEYKRLLPESDLLLRLADQSLLIEEFLVKEFTSKRLKTDVFTKDTASVKLHVHCHQKAVSNAKVTFDLINLIPNYKVTLINSGCCGMAGSFGYEKEHYELSMKMGELRLFKSIRNSDSNTIIVANGTSCRHQIADGTDKLALHPVQLLEQSLLPSEAWV